MNDRRLRTARASLRGAALVALLACAGAPALADILPAITAPGPADELKSRRQREEVRALAERRLGTSIRGGELVDLDVLQRLLDGRHVARDDVESLQALGVVLGDVMVEQLRLGWVVVDDDLGRSRGLRLGRSENLFFPITMISKRIANGEPVSVRALYDKVAADVARLEARTQPKRRSLERPAEPAPAP